MRKKYQKPQVKKVKLTPAEAVLAGCKIDMSASGGSKKCLENSCLNRLQGS